MHEVGWGGTGVAEGVRGKGWEWHSSPHLPSECRHNGATVKCGGRGEGDAGDLEHCQSVEPHQLVKCVGTPQLVVKQRARCSWRSGIPAGFKKRSQEGSTWDLMRALVGIPGGCWSGSREG